MILPGNRSPVLLAVGNRNERIKYLKNRTLCLFFCRDTIISFIMYLSINYEVYKKKSTQQSADKSVLVVSIKQINESDELSVLL